MHEGRLLALAGVVLAAGGVAASAQPSAEPVDLLDATCEQYLEAARTADPGQRPSRKRQREAEAAQDSLVDAMLWVHGYTSGKLAAGRPPTPLTRDWIVEHVRSLAQSCQSNSPDGTMRLVDAAMRL